MTPTDKLRALLDECGVEYDTSEDDTTIFYDVDGNRYTYNVNPESGWAQLYGYNLTPEQAIAATVGADYAIIFAPTLDRPPETMVGETVFDLEGNAIGWIVNAMVGERTSRNERTASIVKVPHKDYISIGHYECGGCGATIDAGDRFCRKCGAHLEGAEE